MSLLRISHLVRDFGGNRAVDDVSLELEAGELVALIGPNGAGKSTVFNMLGGQIQATSGSVLFDGQSILGQPSHRISRMGIGRSFQIAATFASMTVLENIQMALLASYRRIWSFWRPASAQYEDEALDLLEQVGMRDQARRPCSELAYGDVKRVELAVSLAGQPRLLLMDEPTAGMGAAERNALMALVKRLVAERGMAVLFTEHSMDVVFGYADRILVLARGRLIAQGDAQEVRSHPEVRRVYFGSGATFSGVASPEADILPSSDDRSAIGRSDTAPDETLLRIQGLNAWYGDAHILRDVSLLAGRGEVVALMGRNGAGKSTTMKAAMGLLRRRTGLIDFMGADISASQPCDVARLGLGYVPEDRRIFTDLTVTENLLAGRQPQREGAPGWSLDEVFELFPHLAGLRRRRAGEMSGGEQQMLAVARTLMGNPHLMLLDEPSEGVAPVIVEQMAQMILALKGRGASVLLSEQNLHFACLVSDRAYVLEKGVIRYEGSMAALAGDDMLRSKYLEL